MLSRILQEISNISFAIDKTMFESFQNWNIEHEIIIGLINLNQLADALKLHKPTQMTWGSPAALQTGNSRFFIFGLILRKIKTEDVMAICR
jgi:hypothetical protein